MFSIYNFLLCLVALFTSIVSCLPLAPSSATLHDLDNSTTATTTSISSLLPRYGPYDDDSLEKQRKFCRDSYTYCEEMSGFDPPLADMVFCTFDPAHCRDIFGASRCTPWGAGPWWCHPGLKPPVLNGDLEHDRTALFPPPTPTASHDKSDAIPSPPPPAATEVTVTAIVTKEFMVPEQTAATTLINGTTPSPTSTESGNGKSIHKRFIDGWWCLFLCD